MDSTADPPGKRKSILVAATTVLFVLAALVSAFGDSLGIYAFFFGSPPDMLLPSTPGFSRPATPEVSPTSTATPTTRAVLPPPSPISGPTTNAVGGTRQATDLIAAAHRAVWTSSNGTVRFGVSPSAEQGKMTGSAKYVDSSTFLDNDERVTRGVMTTPPWAMDAWIKGVYQLERPIQSGQHLKVKAGDARGDPGNGYLSYRILCSGGSMSGERTVVEEIDNTNDEDIIIKDVSLAGCSGATAVTLIATALSTNGAGNWAIWAECRITA